MPTAGACGSGSGFEDAPDDAESVPWTARALPSVTLLTTTLETGADPRFNLPAAIRARLPEKPGDDVLLRQDGVFRLTLVEPGRLPPAALLPFDELFEVRATAAVRLWRALNGRVPGKNPAKLSRQGADRLILALRALDGKLEGRTHRQIAAGLFPEVKIADGGWISHDLRDRTARLVRLGTSLTAGGYRRLLLHPYRRTFKG